MSMKTTFLSPKNFNIISGIIIIVLSILIFIYSAAAVVFVLLILAIIMIFLGITHLMNIRSEVQNSKGGGYLKFKRSNLIFNYLIVALELLMGIVLTIGLIYDPIGTAVISIRLVGFVIFLIGLYTLYLGSKNYEYRKEFRSILVIIGSLTIIFGLLIVFIPTIGFNIIAVLVALPLLFIGMIRTLKGILS
ncbi:MAG: DUF308 domain-containing protein [Promethearchaeota archaeon]